MFRYVQARTTRILATLGMVLLPGPLARAQATYPEPSSRVVAAALVRSLLTSVSWQQRAEAAQLLGQTGDPAAIEALSSAAVNDHDGRVRQAASDAIVQIRKDVRGGLIGRRPPPHDLGFPDPFPPPVRPRIDPAVELVQSWYQRYLRRSVDQAGLQNFVLLLRQGTPQEELQAAIMGGPEYYQLQGNDPARFVTSLYADVLGRRASNAETSVWLDGFVRYRGDRTRLALQFLRNAQAELLANPSYGYPSFR